eukprot:scaffold54026_cov32-Attheya_sp.AAC.1
MYFIPYCPPESFSYTITTIPLLTTFLFIMPPQSLKRYVLDELHDIAEMGLCRELIFDELLSMPLDPIM